MGNRIVTAALLALGLCTARCSNPLDACSPKESNLGFFSKGDCMLTRASFFQGHEWLTWFGNRDLPAEDRFSEDEIHTIAEGNRRVDWPKELLIHLNNGVLAYANALLDHTNRPENQRYHFLLDHKNDTAQATADSRATIVELTRDAARHWVSNRVRALTLIGKANHVLQDSFSEAHAVREPNHATHPWCVRKVKAYIERDDGYDTPDIEYHGGDGADGIGHTTTQDSIYREGRDCHEPTTAEQVDACLSGTALRARLGTRDYLAAMRRVLSASLEGAALDALVESELGAYFAEHMELCP